jgi:hypothetical protein
MCGGFSSGMGGDSATASGPARSATLTVFQSNLLSRRIMMSPRRTNGLFGRCRKQARTILRYVRGLLDRVPALAAVVEASRADSLDLAVSRRDVRHTGCAEDPAMIRIAGMGQALQAKREESHGITTKRITKSPATWRCRAPRYAAQVPVLLDHARGESRTRTGLPPADFESAASAIPPLGRVGLQVQLLPRLSQLRRLLLGCRWCSDCARPVALLLLRLENRRSSPPHPPSRPGSRCWSGRAPPGSCAQSASSP